MGRFALSIALLAANLCPVECATARNYDGPIVANGKCDKRSGVEVAETGFSRFGCNAVVIARSNRGTVLIQFADKSGRDGRILGFAGAIEGKQGFGAERTQALEVERIYLMGGGRPINVSRGTCFLNWSAGKLTSALCDAVAEVEGQEIKAISIISIR